VCGVGVTARLSALLTIRWPFWLALALACYLGGREWEHEEHVGDYALGYTAGREDEARAVLWLTPHVDVTRDGVRLVYYGACRQGIPDSVRLP